MIANILNAAFLAWIGLLLYKGLHSSDNWLGWFMFSRARYFQSELSDVHGAINIWDYLPHCQVILSKRQIEALIRHIQTTREGGFVCGTVTMLTTDGVQCYTVRRSHLIPNEDDEVGV